MKIPNCEKSIVEDEKITAYLLNDSHFIGKHKSKYFKRFGFDAADIGTFKESLIQHSIDRDIGNSKKSKFGKKYELKCEIKTPDKRNPCVVTIWIVEKDNACPRLITAYPTTNKKN